MTGLPLPDNMTKAQHVALDELVSAHGEPDVIATLDAYSGVLHPLVRLEWWEDGFDVLLAASGQAIRWRYFKGGDDDDD
jgi:hypothetical protein